MRTEASPDAAVIAGMGTEVGSEVAARGAEVVVGGESRNLRVIEDDFPAYQVILDDLPATVCRVVVDRLRLLELLTGGTVALDIQPGRLTVSEIGDGADATGDGESIEAVGVGEVRVGFTAAVLAAALSVSVGPDVLLEISAPARPVIVRSADQGTFTTLVMPFRLDG